MSKCTEIIKNIILMLQGPTMSRRRAAFGPSLSIWGQTSTVAFGMWRQLKQCKGLVGYRYRWDDKIWSSESILSNRSVSLKVYETSKLCTAVYDALRRIIQPRKVITVSAINAGNWKKKKLLRLADVEKLEYQPLTSNDFQRLRFDWSSFNNVLFFCSGLTAPTGGFRIPALYIHITVVDGNEHSFAFSLQILLEILTSFAPNLNENSTSFYLLLCQWRG